MTYIENVFVCMAAPLVVALLSLKRGQRAALVFWALATLCALAAAYPAPGVTRWPVEGRAGAGPPGGVLLWVAPEALADADLQAAVSSHPPLLALICDLQDWLPQGADARLGAAQALRFLVDGPLPRVAVHARALGEAWEDFFQEHWAEFGREGAVTRSPSLAETAAGAGVSLPIGRPEPLAARCHDCGATISPWASQLR